MKSGRFAPMENHDIPTRDLAVDWQSLCRQAESLLEGEHDAVANAANLSALLFASLPAVNWVGFYYLRGEQLVVGPFQGLPACVRIPLGQGVCGTAAATRVPQRVSDVHAFPGHIACDPASRSELVVPLIRNDKVLGVLDIDSPYPARFSKADEAGARALAGVYCASLAD